MERPKIDFARIKREVLVEDVARRYGVDLRGKNPWLHGKCPLPTHESKDSKTSFAVNVHDNYWLCHSDSCKKNRKGKGGGDVIGLVAIKENCEQYDAATKLIDWYHLNGDEKTPSKDEAVHSPRTLGTRDTSHPTEPPAENKPLAFAGFKDLDTTHEYLRNRGVRITTAEEFGVGYFAGRSSVIKDPHRIVIPIHNRHGQLVAYAGRSLDPQAPDKYHFPAGFHKSLELFNLHRVSTEIEVLVIVEGFFGCMALHQDGIPSVALMGCTLSAEQERLLAAHFPGVNPPGVVVLLDGDKPGRENAAAIAARLGQWTFVRVIVLPDGKQPDTLTIEEKAQFLNPAILF